MNCIACKQTIHINAGIVDAPPRIILTLTTPKLTLQAQAKDFRSALLSLPLCPIHATAALQYLNKGILSS